METVLTENMPDLRLSKSRDLKLEIADLLQPHRYGRIEDDGMSRQAVDLINNSLQALVNLFYLIARESRLEPQLQPLVAQTQAELAHISRHIQKLSEQ